MKILFVADGRSAIALNWMGYFSFKGWEVHLASSFDCSPPISLASLHIIPVAMSGVRSPERAENLSGKALRGLPVSLRTSLRRWLGPLTLGNAARSLRQVITQVKPDLVHAMRIPFEGMLAAQALIETPAPGLLVSVWGNDFTLHASSTPLMRHFTRQTLQRADALHTDCQRDLRLARLWGFSPRKKSIVLPGAGGVQLDVFYPGESAADSPSRSSLFQVINPRGVRAYIRNDIFFQAASLVRREYPQIHLVCPGMAGEPSIQRMVNESQLRDIAELLPSQTRPQMAELFRRCQAAVSPSEHDGTPNTLLEAMATGCFPIAGDIESIREWIEPGVNGLLFSPDNPHELAAALIRAIREPELRQAAREHNLRLVMERAEHRKVMQQAEAFYQSLV